MSVSDEVQSEPAAPPAPATAQDALEALAASFPLVVVFDAVALAMAVLLGITVGFDTTLVGRGPLALVFFLFVPGWCLLRAWAIPPTSLSLLTGVGLSISITFLSGQALIAWGWGAWRVTTVLVCVLCTIVLARDLDRERR